MTSELEISEVNASQYRIVVSKPSRHGRTKLHTFGIHPEAPHLGWFVETPVSRKQLKERQVPGSALPSSWPPPERRPLGIDYYDRLDDPGSIDLDGNGSDVSRRAFAVVLDALRAAGWHEVDLGDVNDIISQYGAGIAKFVALDEDGQRHARDALHAQIRKRCIRL